MCEYCENGKPIISNVKQFSDRAESIVGSIVGGKIIVSALTLSPIVAIPPAVAEVEIGFCPMYGRKLEVE